MTLADVVDDRVGIVRSCTRLSKGRTEPAMPIVYQATLSHFDYRKGSVAERTASGKGVTDEAAWRGALVEALERYCAYQQRPDMVVRATAGALDAPAIAPEELVLYSERQYARSDFPYRRPGPDQELTWVRGELVDGRGPVYVPASMVYMNYGGPGGRELFTPTTSNGLAGGPDLTSATLAGLYEVIERDAFLLNWMHRRGAARINLDAMDGPVAAARRHYARYGIELHAFDVTSDVGVPVAMAMTVDRTGRGPAAVVGLGCNVDGRVALERAVMEVGQVRAGAVPRHRREPPRLTHYEDVRTLEDHAAFAAMPEHLGEFSFLLEGTATVAPPGPPGEGPELDQVRTCLQAVGATVAVVDLTQPDVEPFGVRVVRALATGLQPIHFGHGEERLGGQRVREDALNPCPHPIA
jgi:ribosomal protein S12 methylthiotransferase accessory factor